VYSYTGPLAAGDYALSATATDYADLAPGTIVTVVADSANAAKSVTLDHLESLTITVNGKTSSAAATPLSGATITAIAGTTTVTLTPTGTAGEYSYVGELSGTYTITASKNGFATDSTTTVTAVSYGDATDTVTLNHLEKITLTLNGSSATSTASALSGAAVTTVIGTTTVTFTEIGTTGVYVYEGRLSGSSYVVQAVKDGYTTGTVTVTRVQYGDAPDNLTLTAQTQTLTVTVQDNLAAVVGSIQVKATQGSTSLSGTTDATTGTYDFILAPGVWVITATVPYTDATPTTYSTSTSHTVTVPIGSGTTQTVTVSP
jgi:hypothetical protein